jgi:hypothetical protein
MATDERLMQEIIAATNWWTNHLRTYTSVNSRIAALGQNPDPAGIGLVYNAASQIKPVPQEQIDKFHTALMGELVRLLVVENKARITVTLVTDWHPLGIIQEACKYAGISGLTELRFPVKTAMWFAEEGVKVRVGYGGEHQTIYPIAGENSGISR